MRPRNYNFTQFAAPLMWAAALAFAIWSPAQAKEGTWSDTIAGFETFKATQVGKDRLLLVFDDHFLSVSDNPMFDHLTWHLWGLADCIKGMCEGHGYGVATDPAGDQFVQSFVLEKFALGQKTVKGSLKLSGGFGKFDGITGTGTYVGDGATFRATEEGTFFEHGTRQYNYKLP
jgi:hypothetical protein